METTKMTTTINHDSRLFYTDSLGIKTEYYNPNPWQTGNEDEEDRHDCVIRAISKLLDKSWKETYHELFNIGSNMGITPESDRSVTILMAKYGYIDISDILTKNSIISTGEFMYQNKTGKYLISNCWHTIAYIDGVWYDNKACLEYPAYFLINEHNGVFVSLYNNKFKKLINDKFGELNKLSDDKTYPNHEAAELILEELSKHKSCDSIFEPGALLSSLSEDNKYIILLSCIKLTSVAVRCCRKVENDNAILSFYCDGIDYSLHINPKEYFNNSYIKDHYKYMGNVSDSLLEILQKSFSEGDV